VPGDLDIALTERYPGQAADTAIKPADPCRARLGADLVITGHVDRLQPSIDARRHALRVQGRGKCADPVDRSAGSDTGGKPKGMELRTATLLEPVKEPDDVRPRLPQRRRARPGEHGLL